MQTNIETARLTLHVVRSGDWKFILELLNTPGWIEFIGDRYVHSKKDAVAFIDKINATDHFTYFVTRLKTDGTPIGVISFIKRDYLDHFDLGFAFLPQYNGKGYAYEAAQEVLRVATQYPEHPSVLATAMPSNQKSIGLLTKLGFQFYKEMVVQEERINVYSYDAQPGLGIQV